MSFAGNQYSNYADKVITTKGDIVRGNSTGDRERYGIGSANQILTSISGEPTWQTLSTAGSVLTTQGDVLYHNASGLARLGFGTAGDVLTTQGTGADPSWTTIAGLTETTGLSASNYAGVYSGSSQVIGVNTFTVGDQIDSRMPSGQKFLQCVALECKIGAVASGNFRLSLWCRSSLRGKMSCMAWCPEASASAFGTDTIAKVATIGSTIIPNAITNEDFLISIITDDGTFTCYTLGGTGVGQGVAYTADTPLTTDHDISNSFGQPELKAYFTGYS